MWFKQSEATAARRRFHLYLVDATDGLTPETGEAGGQPQVSKNGAAFVNTTATLTAIGNGSYYVELTAAELDTLGQIIVRYKSANTAEFAVPAPVVAVDVFDSVRAGLTALPNAAADAAGGLIISDAGGLDADAQRADVAAILVDTGTTLDARLPAALVGGRIDANVGAISGDAVAADNLEAAADGTGFNLGGGAVVAASVTGAVGSVTAGVTLAASAVQAIWDALTSALTTVGSIGKLLVDNIDAAISSRLATAAYTAPPTAAANADAVWDELRSGHTVAGSYGQSLQIVRDGTAQAGAASTMTLDTGASAINDFYNNAIIFIVGGTGVGQARFVADYVGATKVATVDPNWVTTPDATSVFVILPFGQVPGATAPTAIEVADTLLDRDMSLGTDSGTETVRTVRQALRALRNAFTISGTTRTVMKEDNITPSWTSEIQVDSSAFPIVGDTPSTTP